VSRSGYEQFVAAHGRRLMGQAVLLAHHHADAQDLVQETLARLYVAWPRVREPESFCRVVLTRLAISRWRRLSRRPEPRWRLQT
jgi:DNA-directed RNA polymerase specialized sigma24 family protein